MTTRTGGYIRTDQPQDLFNALLGAGDLTRDAEELLLATPRFRGGTEIRQTRLERVDLRLARAVPSATSIAPVERPSAPKRTDCARSGPARTSRGEDHLPATEPEQIHGLFEQAFNAGDVEALIALYESNAALIPQPGTVAEGTAAIRDSLRWFSTAGARSRSTRSSSSASATSPSSRTAGR